LLGRDLVEELAEGLSPTPGEMGHPDQQNPSLQVVHEKPRLARSDRCYDGRRKSVKCRRRHAKILGRSAPVDGRIIKYVRAREKTIIS
jgi:hypothetical protein